MATERELILKISVVAPNTSAFESDAKKTASSVENIEDAAKGASDSIEEIGPAMAESSAIVNEEALKVGEAFRTAAEGAFTMARGIALSAISSEEDLAEVVEQIAKIQGAFDVFKGSLDILKGLSEGLKALKAGTEAATVANSAFAASNTVVAATSAAAAVSVRSMTLALGPIAIALAAAGAAYIFMTRQTTDAKKETVEFEAGLAKVKFGLESVLEVSDRTGAAISAGVVDTFQLAILQSDALDDAFGRLTSGGALKTTESIGSLSEGFKTLLGPDGIGGGIDSIDELEDKLRSLRDVAADRFDPFEDFDRLGAGGSKGALATAQATDLVKIEQALNEIGAIRERQLQQRISLNEQEAGLIEKRLADEEKALELAKNRFRVEQDRFQSAEQAFGALTRLEQEEVKRVVEKADRQGVTSLRRDEIQKIEKFRPEQARQARIARAAAGGGAAVFGTAPDPNFLTAVGQTRTETQVNVDSLRRDLLNTGDQRLVLLGLVGDLAEQVVTERRTTLSTITALENAVDEIRKR